MEIVVIDQGPELFWYVNNAMVNEQVHLKHIKTKQSALDHIFKELPEIVIINGDEPELNVNELISKIRNHAFLRNIQFVVSTGNSSADFRKDLMMSGAGYILFRNKNGYTIPPTFFRNILKWFLSVRSSDANSFQDQGVEVKVEGTGLTFGRLSSIFYDGTCLIENNLDLSVGDKLEIDNAIFEELGMKHCHLKVVKKDYIGRYYQYAHSYLCQIEFEDPTKHLAVLHQWIDNNYQINKNKGIKVVYFESHPDYREELRQKIKADAKYCARGYKNLDDILYVLDYQKPDFILVNRSLMEADIQNFTKIKDYLKKSHCFLITYNENHLAKEEIEKIKTDHPYALHSNGLVDLSTLNAMVEKVISGKATELKNIVFGKHSSYSRVNIHLKTEIIELGEYSISFKCNLKADRFMALSLNSSFFSRIKLAKNQLFRVYDIKSGSTPIQKAIFVCQNNTEKELIKETIKRIKEEGFDSI